MSDFRDTDMLIERLGRGGTLAQRLPRPWIRTMAWLALAIPCVALVVVAMSPRTDLIAKISDPRFVIEQFATLATGIAAALAAFATTIPAYDRRIVFLPALPVAIWLGMLGEGCVQDWLQYGAGGLSLQPDWLCLPAIALVGAVPAITMAIMLRRGAPLTPHLTTALGGLAAAGLGNFGLRLFHPQNASLMVLVWQFGTVFALSALAAWSGNLLLSWRSILDQARQRIASG
jgi:hypothetical protein